MMVDTCAQAADRAEELGVAAEECAPSDEAHRLSDLAPSELVLLQEASSEDDPIETARVRGVGLRQHDARLRDHA